MDQTRTHLKITKADSRDESRDKSADASVDKTDQALNKWFWGKVTSLRTSAVGLMAFSGLALGGWGWVEAHMTRSANAHADAGDALIQNQLNGLKAGQDRLETKVDTLLEVVKPR